MRVTILNQFYRPDIAPTSNLAASLAEGLASKGHQLTIVASRGGYVSRESNQEGQASSNPKVYRVWTPMLGKKSVIRRCLDYLFYYILSLLRILFLPKQDVIISLTTPPFIIWVAFAHRLIHRKTKVILWNMDCYPEAAERAGKLKPYGLTSRIMRWANRLAFKRIDHLIVLDSAMRDLLMDQYAPEKNPPKWTVIPNWEEASFFPADAETPVWEGINRFNLQDQFIVVYLGNMGVGHQFDSVIEAAILLRDQQVTFLMVGGGAKYPSIENAKKEHGLDNLILQPYVPKEVTSQIMAAADCALITLRDDMLGVMSPSKVHANLATRLPILYVGPEGSNVDEAVTHFDCGLSVKHGEPEKIVEFIQLISQDREHQQHLRNNARKAFDEQYNDIKTLPLFEKVLRSIQ